MVFHLQKQRVFYIVTRRKRGDLSLKFSERLGDILREDLLTLVIWNFLFVLTCIPIITIGPALTALSHCTCYLVHNDVIMEKPSKIYINAFKESFKSTFIWGLLVLVTTTIFGGGFFIYSHMLSENMLYVPLTAGSIIGLVVTWGIYTHLFPAFIENENATGRIRTAASFSLIRMKKTLLALIISAIILLLQILMFPVLTPMSLSIGFVFPSTCLR